MEKVPDIGKGISSKLDTLIKTGELDDSPASCAKKFRPALMDVMRLPALGPKRVRQLHDELGIESLDDLKNALEAGALRTIRGFGPKMEESLRQALERRVAKSRSNDGSMPDAAIEVERLLDHLRGCAAVRAHRSRGKFPSQTRHRRRSRSARDFE